MKDLRLKEATKHYCNWCDYQTCIKKQNRKNNYDCKVFKKYLKSTNKMLRKKLNKIDV